MSFRVGQKVVCVDVDGIGEADGKQRLVLNKIYTILKTGKPNPRKDKLGRGDPVGVHLVEVVRIDRAPYGGISVSSYCREENGYLDLHRNAEAARACAQSRLIWANFGG